ncbi:MAG: urease accessory protein UreH domain-containing protein [Candidatus Anammoxibacter sp.]
MTHELLILTITAASIGFFHTLFGPDHYLPFIMLSKAKKWSLNKTSWVTLLCGTGHIFSSVLLGVVGVALGFSIKRLEAIELFRGGMAAWALIAFGLVYFVWGLRRAIRNKPHTHKHYHESDDSHVHSHSHNKEHLHVHEKESKNITPWILFTIFVFGPCEPLIPLLMYPAAKSSYLGLITVTCVFAAVTLSTMLGIVISSSFGINLLPFGKLERYTHAIAAASICCCGLVIQFCGL